MSLLPRLCFVGALVLASAVAAHEGHQQATGVVAERTDLMKEVGRATKQSANMLNGKITYDAAVLRANAELIARSGGTALMELFPVGSDSTASDALPTVWEDWPRFEAYAKQMSRLAEALRESTSNPLDGSTAAPTANSAGTGLLGSAAEGPSLLTDEAILDLAAGPPRPAFEALVKSCNACHTAFRKPQ